MNGDMDTAEEIKGKEESALAVVTAFSLPKYAVDSVRFYKEHPEVFKNEVLSGITARARVDSSRGIRLRAPDGSFRAGPSASLQE